MRRTISLNDSNRLRQENHQLKELLQAARLVFSTLELNTALDAILKSAQELTHATVVSIALLDDETGELSVCAHRGFDEDFLGTSRWKPQKGGLTEKVIKGRKILVVQQRAHKRFFRDRVRINQKVKAMACVPLVFESKVMGILFADDYSLRGFSESEQRALTVLATFAATAIDHAKLHRLTKELARTDGLTGLYNYRYFHERLEDEISRAQRYQRTLSLIMLDVDNFKHFNDAYGHSVGDALLKKIASVIRESLRDVDLASRYGGEEFTVMLPETNTTQALPLAERLRRNIEERTPGSFGIKSKEGAMVSLGIACFPWNAQDKDELIRRADEAMYTAKAQGKNRVVACTRP